MLRNLKIFSSIKNNNGAFCRFCVCISCQLSNNKLRKLFVFEHELITSTFPVQIKTIIVLLHCQACFVEKSGNIVKKAYRQLSHDLITFNDNEKRRVEKIFSSLLWVSKDGEKNLDANFPRNSFTSIFPGNTGMRMGQIFTRTWFEAA